MPQTEQAGRNENKPHPMSLDSSTTGDKPSRYDNGEGRREGVLKQSMSPHRSSGVSVGGMSGSDTRVSWETCHGGSQDSTHSTSGQVREAVRAAAGVGDLRSSDDPSDTITDGERREGTCSRARERRDSRVMARPSEIETPVNARIFNLSLYREAQANAEGQPGKGNSESRVRENRMHGLMRGKGVTVISLLASQSVLSSLLYSVKRLKPV